jgi:hypothetical protein
MTTNFDNGIHRKKTALKTKPNLTQPKSLLFRGTVDLTRFLNVAALFHLGRSSFAFSFYKKQDS